MGCKEGSAVLAGRLFICASAQETRFAGSAVFKYRWHSSEVRMVNTLKHVVKAPFFLLRPDEFAALGYRHLAIGMLCAWAAGMGRHYDRPRALLIQKVGIISPVVAIVIAAVIYFVALPLLPRLWTCRRVLTFVALSSPLAFIYAIPVERFLDIDTADKMNLSFLAVVSIWRVGLLAYLLKRLGALGWFGAITCTFLPLTIVVFTLTVLNLDHVVLNLMAGLTDDGRSPYDSSYGVLVLLSVVSFVGLPVFGCLYGVAAYLARRAASAIGQSHFTLRSDE